MTRAWVWVRRLLVYLVDGLNIPGWGIPGLVTALTGPWVHGVRNYFPESLDISRNKRILRVTLILQEVSMLTRREINSVIIRRFRGHRLGSPTLRDVLEQRLAGDIIRDKANRSEDSVVHWVEDALDSGA